MTLVRPRHPFTFKRPPRSPRDAKAITGGSEHREVGRKWGIRMSELGSSFVEVTCCNQVGRGQEAKLASLEILT